MDLILGVFLPGKRSSDMKRETGRNIKDLVYYSSIGLQVALSIFIGLAAGIYLDRRYDTTPWMTLIFLILWIAAGYRNIGHALRKIRKSDEQNL